MKVIELLNKIANNEELPNKIKYRIYEYFYNEDVKVYQRYESDNEDTYSLGEDWMLDHSLNENIEIIEDKKIEKLNPKANFIEDEEVLDKINELIDKVNKLKENK